MSEYLLRVERLYRQLRNLGLDPDRFRLNDLLTTPELPTVGLLRERLVENGMLAGQSLSADYVADALFDTLNAVLASLSPSLATSSIRYAEFKQALETCPTGQSHFSAYENLGTEIWRYIFSPDLAFIAQQGTTRDRLHRFDALFRNDSTNKFWEHVKRKYHAEYIILDFKNEKKLVAPTTVEDVTKYTNAQTTCFLVLISRMGGNNKSVDMQLRLLRDRTILVLIVSDRDLLTMIQLKESKVYPESVLAEQLDNLMRIY